MTEEERGEAERLAKQFFEGDDDLYESDRYAFEKGYAACAESKRVEIDESDQARDLYMGKAIRMAELCQAERARSAKLISVLKSVYLSSDLIRTYADVSQAIAEYEGTK